MIKGFKSGINVTNEELDSSDRDRKKLNSEDEKLNSPSCKYLNYFTL